MKVKLARWVIFSVMIALLPLLFTYIYFLTINKLITLEALLARGELLLISVALAADAMGGLIASGKERPILKIMSGGGCLVSAFFASLYFAAVSSNTGVNASWVFWTSVIIFVLVLIAGASCKLLAEDTQ